MKPCDHWGGKPSQKYGYITIAGVTISTHRLVWMQSNGPIPDGLWVLHSCDTPSCIEITHLRLGTPADNVQDRDSRGRNYLLSRDECPNGHPFDEANTYLRRDGARACKQCRRDVQRHWREENKAKRAAYMKEWQAKNADQRKDYMREWRQSRALLTEGSE